LFRKIVAVPATMIQVCSKFLKWPSHGVTVYIGLYITETFNIISE